MVVGERDFSDMVLEADHTTDGRRGKPRLYEACGFLEAWVEAPEGYSASRPPGRRPLRVHPICTFKAPPAGCANGRLGGGRGAGQRPFQTGGRFSAKARVPSCRSSLA